MKKALFSISVFCFVLACTHIGNYLPFYSKKVSPPEFHIPLQGELNQSLETISRLEKESLDQASKWWLSYRKAQISERMNLQGESCKAYQELSQENDFPLSKVAHLRSLLYCDLEKNQKPISPLKNTETWLLPLGQEIFLNQVAKLSDPATKFSSLKDVMEFSVDEETKLSTLNEAIQIGEKIGVDESQIQSMKEELYLLSPKLHPDPEKVDPFRLALDHRKSRELSSAVAIYQKIISNSKTIAEDRYRAHRELRMTYRLMGRTEKYISETERMAKWAQSLATKYPRTGYQRIYFDAHITWARAVWTEGQTDQAVRILRDLQSRLSGKHPLGQAYWLQARIREERNRPDHAIYWLNKAMADAFPLSPSLRESVLWHKAWNLRKQKDYSEAAKSFQALIENTEDPYARHRYTYWLARSLRDLNPKDETAHSLLDQLTTEDNLGYYGMLAYRELNRPIPGLNLDRNLASKENSKSYISANKRNTLEWLISLDESKLALNYLEELAAELGSSPKKPEAWVELLTYYARAGHYLPLFQQIGKVESELRDQILSINPEYLFPRPYFELTQKAGEKIDISTDLIYSVMRQESAFDPQARSHADAFGLLQLLPSVADKIAKRYSVTYNGFEDLYEPNTNITLGSYLLKELFQKYNDQFILAVASYNASEDAIRGWIQTRFHGDPTSFIEDIPYDETRNYVKLVLRNYILYSRISAKDSEISFPEWCLQNLHRFKS